MIAAGRRTISIRPASTATRTNGENRAAAVDDFRSGRASQSAPSNTPTRSNVPPSAAVDVSHSSNTRPPPRHKRARIPTSGRLTAMREESVTV